MNVPLFVYFISQLIMEGDIMGLVQIIIILISHTLSQYLFCHFGDRVTQRFEEIGDALYNISWYLLPPKVQKHLPVAIANAQKRVYVQGCADIRSNKELFRKVGFSLAQQMNRFELIVFAIFLDDQLEIRFIIDYAKTLILKLISTLWVQRYIEIYGFG